MVCDPHKGFSVVNEAEVDVFLELPCFLHDSTILFFWYGCEENIILYQVAFKVFQAKFQQYVKQELPDVQAGFRKGRGTRDQTANIHWITEKAKEFQTNIYFCFIDYTKA